MTIDKTIRIAVDIGGTFTDLQILDERSGRRFAHKTPTTPEDPSIGLMEGIVSAAGRFGFGLDDVGLVLHGTTIATNAILERKLPAGALVTTAGFEDVLEIGRHTRREVYSIWPQPPAALIPRNRRLGVAERMRADGSAELPLAPAVVEGVLERLGGLDIETVAVCLLHAYANPAHEMALAAEIERALPHVTVSRSCEISPEIREYERTSTTVLNALLQPVVRRYIQRLLERMRAASFQPRLLIVQSSGGVCAPETAAHEPVRLLLSGPSGGAMAARALAELLNTPDAVGVDMGGTSFDVSVVRNNRIEVINEGEIDGLPVRVPMVEVRTIGAGGGSIARVHAGRQVSVGPESAGARPGPVCYGRGGTEPTVTDANLILGRLDPVHFLGGAMALDLDGARDAVARRIAEPLGISVEAAADGMLQITNTKLAGAIRVSLFEKGLDPRDFALMSFGGAGSVHACAVAEELGIRAIVFPKDASTLSAAGILNADIVQGFARSNVRRLDADALAIIAAMTGEMETEAHDRLATDGILPEDRELLRLIDVRYRGQAFELSLPWEGGFDAPGLDRMLAAFHNEHERRFSYANRDDVVEMVTFRIDAVGKLTRPAAYVDEVEVDGQDPHERLVFVNGNWAKMPVYARRAIAKAVSTDGPAIIEEDYTTIFLAPQWRLQRAPQGHLVARFLGENG